ncbi:hypothetical protein P5V15_005856 [Pogonomyrmex californicus]
MRAKQIGTNGYPTQCLYNTTPHTATGFTPFELIYGHRAELPTALTTEVIRMIIMYKNYERRSKCNEPSSERMCKARKDKIETVL